MKQFEVITPWLGTGTEEDSNRPQLGDQYVIKKWQDVTGQPSENLLTNPNTYTILAECEDAVFDQIAADSTYHVLWSADI